jgi:hypothetical protein
MRPLWSGLLWLLIIVGLPWMVCVMVQELRQVQVWEVLIQTPSAPPVPPWRSRSVMIAGRTVKRSERA